MTREEAIDILRSYLMFDKSSMQIDIALNMAIEALSAEGAVLKEYEAEFTDLPDIPRYYYEKVVGKMAHEINMLKEQLESANAEQGVGRYENAMQKLREMPRYLNGVKEKQITKISADAVQGEWIIHGEPPWLVRECSECGAKWHQWSGDKTPNYCGNCGARMEATNEL